MTTCNPVLNATQGDNAAVGAAGNLGYGQGHGQGQGHTACGVKGQRPPLVQSVDLLPKAAEEHGSRRHDGIDKGREGNWRVTIWARGSGDDVMVSEWVSLGCMRRAGQAHKAPYIPVYTFDGIYAP